jgi:nitroreductase
MSQVLEAIKDRRSIRKFTEQDLSQEQLDALLEAVRWAPSWANTQCWELVVVRDQGVKEALQATFAKGNPATKAVVVAPVVFVLCAKLGEAGYYKGEASTKFGDWYMFDLGLASQNLHLAAHALGLATVPVGLFDHDAAAKAVGLPEGHELVAIYPVGHPDQEPKPPKRKEVSEFVHQDRW